GCAVPQEAELRARDMDDNGQWLRVSERGRRKRKADSDDNESEGQGDFYADGGGDGRHERKKKWRSWDKLFVRMWKRLKQILKTLSPRSKMPNVSKKVSQQFSFLREFEDKESKELRDDNDEDTS
ncbi:hypothetical protein HAX54_037663, partial [Datura stramonium]|nr:hypothetical protein [Datura stramonium]